MSAMNEFEALKKGLNGLAQQGYINPKDQAPQNNDDHEEFVPPDNMQFVPMRETDEAYDNPITGEEFHEQPQVQQQYDYQDFEVEVHQPIDENDEALWTGGPLKSEVESWKKQYGDIYLADDVDPNQPFIYRTLNRYEYKAIIATPNTDPLMREEMYCEQCVLYPYGYSYAQMSRDKAGNISTLAEQILATSGFNRASMPRRL